MAAGRTACSSLPECIQSEFSLKLDVKTDNKREATGRGKQEGGRMRNKTEETDQLTLIKLLQESALYGTPAVPLNETSEELVVHLPAVHGFLVFHAVFGDEDVDDPLVCHGAVAFEALADDVAEVDWRDIEGVEGADFWSLSEVQWNG